MAKVQDEIAVLIPLYQQFLRERRKKFERDVQRMRRAKGASTQPESVVAQQVDKRPVSKISTEAEADVLPQMDAVTQPVLIQPSNGQTDFLDELEDELNGETT